MGLLEQMRTFGHAQTSYIHAFGQRYIFLALTELRQVGLGVTVNYKSTGFSHLAEGVLESHHIEVAVSLGPTYQLSLCWKTPLR